MILFSYFWIFIFYLAQANPTADSGAKSLSTGAIIGIVVGAVILIAIIIFVIVVCLKMKCRLLRRSIKQEQSTSSGSNKIPDDLAEKKPNIPQEIIDESTEGHGYVLHSVQSDQHHERRHDYMKREIPTDFTCKRDSDISTKVIIENKNGPFEEISEKKLGDDIVTDINENVENTFPENKADEIVVTRVAENVNVLRKDVPHLNSTDNIFCEYDAAMAYKTESYCISKSDVSLNLKGINWKLIRAEPRALEFPRDDSDLNLISDSKLKSEMQTKARINKSEGNLIDAVRRDTLKRKSSLISRLSITSKSFEWNFYYNSPYALTEKQKQENLNRKIRMVKRKKQIERRKREEKEKRERENAIAFEKWKQRKREETMMNSKNVETSSIASGKSQRFKYWYPT